MKLGDLEKYSKPAVRISMALIFLYFGFQQLTQASDWTSLVPDYALVLGLSAETLVFANSLFELALGSLLLFGLFTRVVSLILAVHLAGITLSLGFIPTAVRDFGLTIATLSIFFNGPDKYCLDRKFEK